MVPGQQIQVEMTKWGNRPHWTYAGIYLGADEYGDWLGCPAGTRYRRPAAEFAADFAGVVLVPVGEVAYLPAFNDQPATSAVYVDIATPAVWDGTVLRSIDLDLDVIRRRDGTVHLDDEDEFAAHQVEYGYPAEVIRLAEQSAADVLTAVRERIAPFDHTSDRWLAELKARCPGELWERAADIKAQLEQARNEPISAPSLTEDRAEALIDSIRADRSRTRTAHVRKPPPDAQD